MYKNASRFYQGFKERRGKKLTGRERHIKGSKNAKPGSKPNVPKVATKPKLKLSEVLNRVYGRSRPSVDATTQLRRENPATAGLSTFHNNALKQTDREQVVPISQPNANNASKDETTQRAGIGGYVIRRALKALNEAVPTIGSKTVRVGICTDCGNSFPLQGELQAHVLNNHLSELFAGSVVISLTVQQLSKALGLKNKHLIRVARIAGCKVSAPWSIIPAEMVPKVITKKLEIDAVVTRPQTGEPRTPVNSYTESSLGTRSNRLHNCDACGRQINKKKKICDVCRYTRARSRDLRACRNCQQLLPETNKFEGYCYLCYCKSHSPTLRSFVQGGSPGLPKRTTLKIGKTKLTN